MTTLESPDRLKKLSPEKRALLLKALRRDGGTPEGGEGISRRPAAGPVPVSFAQGRLWLLDQITPGNPAYNVPFAVRLSGRLDVAALAASLDAVERRHEALRTVFAAGPDGPLQVVGPPARLPLPVADLGALSALSAATRDAETRRLVREDARRPFDLARGPLVRATLLRLAADEHLLLFNLHHIVTDGWSNGLLLSEVAQLYAAAVAGAPSPLPELPVQYADFALWQRRKLSGETLERLLSWWRSRLDGSPAALELPADHPRPAHRAHLGGVIPRRLPASLVAALDALGRGREATLFMVLLAGFQTLLGRMAGVEDVVVGSAVAGRSRAETERLIGFFANTLALRGDLSGDPSFTEMLDRARRATLDGWDHGALPFEKLVEELRPGREAGGNPLFQVVLVLQNAPRPTLALPGLTLEPVDIHSGVAKFDLTLSAEPEADGGLTLWLEHSRELFEAPTAARLLDHLETLLRAAAASPGTRLSELPLLGVAERHQLLGEWHAPAAVVDAETTVHALVEARAAAEPEAPALLADGLCLTYRELEQRANRLAHHLIAMGVRPDMPVGVALERSADLTLTLLAVLKAGGAYLPLDPSYPDERLVQMLGDADPPLVVTRTAHLGRLGGLGRARLVAVDGDGEAIAARGSASPAVPMAPANLAYILYTSGSTGRPKGVAIPHRGVVRLVRDADFARRGPREVFLQLAPIAFDASTLEIWGALANGSCLAVMPAGSPSLPELEAALQRFGVTTLWLTAGLFHQVVDERPSALRGVRRLLTGGDVVSPPHARRLLETFPGHTLIDAYGPTENTTFTCCHWMRELADVGSPVPIGRPAPGNRVYVLDGTFRPVPIGVPGELCAGGGGLARGYTNLPALTAERFVPDPWSGLPGERLYRTGDRVRFLADGRVEFLGRLDHQVKVRGFRLEPEEIETVLATHPAVRQAAVVAVADPHGDKRLVAYVVPEGDGEPVPALKAWLGERLPAWMVPALWVALPEMPLTAYG
ncbi:MAG TPA: amino acid adenylation domain-containing protein [Thermoanaerobaculia bacterium]|nr:amino acid adenylation domain-containing protein [Thermoanaerobaculia bacterium]